MNENKSKAVTIFEQVLINYAAVVIAFSITGWLVGDLTSEGGSLFRLGSKGVAYQSLFQLFIFSLFPSGLKLILFSEYAKKRMLLLWRVALMLILSFLAAAGACLLFDWLPVDNHEAWVWFLASITVSSAAAISFMLIKIKLENRQYDKLLRGYRSSQTGKGGVL